MTEPAFDFWKELSEIPLPTPRPDSDWCIMVHPEFQEFMEILWTDEIMTGQAFGL